MSFEVALSQVGWSVELVSSRSMSDIDRGPLERAELILLTVADDAIATVSDSLAEHASALGINVDAVVAHVSGARGLDALARHRRVGSLHPLMSLPAADIGGRRLLDHCTFAIDGDALLADVVDSLEGRAVHVPADSRALYHATASIAANHLTALCGQVERLAARVGVPVDAYWTLMSTTLANVADRGPSAALTGPAARADWDCVRDHLVALPENERDLYLALCERAAAMAGQTVPSDLRTSDR